MGEAVPGRNAALKALYAGSVSHVDSHVGALLDLLREQGFERVLLLVGMRLRYRPEVLLNVDPSEVYGDRIPTCTDSDMRTAVLAQALEVVSQDSKEGDLHVAEQIFATLDREKFIQIFGHRSEITHSP